GVLAACASSSVSSQSDGPPVTATIDARPNADAPTAARHVTLDSFAQLHAGTSVLDGATIESWGAAEPIAWYTGGLLRHASDTGTITDAASATWAAVQAMPATSRAAIVWSAVTSWGGVV